MAGMKVAEFYEKGLGSVTADHRKAIEWYLSMAEDNITKAQLKLTDLYLAGKIKEIDSEKLVNWLQLKDKSDVQSKNQLTIFYLNGTGVQQNIQKGRELLIQSTSREVSDVQNKLAVMYDRGVGGEKNIFRAVMWFERAAKLGNATAAAHLILLQEDKNVISVMLKYTYNVQILMPK